MRRIGVVASILERQGNVWSLSIPHVQALAYGMWVGKMYRYFKILATPPDNFALFWSHIQNLGKSKLSLLEFHAHELS